MATLAETLAQAVQLQQAGAFPRAEQICREIVGADPRHADAWCLLGRACQAQGRLGEGEEAFGRAVQLAPANTTARNCLGIVLAQQGRLNEAAACFQQRITELPEDPRAHCNLGLVRAQQGRWGEAVVHCWRALRLQPALTEPRSQLEALLGRRVDLPVGIGAGQGGQNRVEIAQIHLEEAVALALQGQVEEAIRRLLQALLWCPDRAEAHCNLGILLQGQGKLEAAANCFQAALWLNPNYPEAHVSWGTTLSERGKLDEAAACFRAALRINAACPEALNNLGFVLLLQGKGAEAVARLRQALHIKPDDAAMHSTLLTYLNYVPQATPASLLAEHRRWADRHAAGLAPGHANSPDPGRRLRVGYVSPDLRGHPLAGFFEPILAHHDPRQVEVFCYAEVYVPDAVTARLRSLAQGWRSTCGLSDAEAATLIRADRIDLLVDLAGHTAHNRLPVFAHKPAPVQLTYLGYPSTTGLSAIDYRLTDAVADPPDDPAPHGEEPWRLPGCFCCYAPPAGAPAVASAPALRRGHITFGSFHGLAKLNGKVLDLWCRLLHALPSSQLLVCRHTLAGTARERLRREFERRGIGAGRVELRYRPPPTSLDYLELYAEVDVLLDTFPWGGHTTACEALWMGVPVHTLSGDRFASRMVSSVLHCLDLAKWVARTPEEYIERGVRLTANLDALIELRRTLREKMQASPLCDAVAFTHRLEEAYRNMWRRWCAAKATH